MSLLITDFKLLEESLQDETLFSYTSGRFLYNEQLRLREKYVRFNVSELEKAVSRQVGHGRVKSIVKISERGFNRVLLATMEDGFRAIVKIPFSVPAPKTYATASEAATLTFLRSKGIPVPEVYGWSSTIENLGTEYIIMECAPRGQRRYSLVSQYKTSTAGASKGIVDIEKKLFAIPFGAFGSLYFKNDLLPQFQALLYGPGTPDEAGDSKTYCIGPITDYMFWDGRRAEMELDRGPCMLFLLCESMVKRSPG